MAVNKKNSAIAGCIVLCGLVALVALVLGFINAPMMTLAVVGIIIGVCAVLFFSLLAYSIIYDSLGGDNVD